MEFSGKSHVEVSHMVTCNTFLPRNKFSWNPFKSAVFSND
jgi:hypothetical protein